MPIELLPLTAERLEDVEALLLPVWNRRWDPDVADRIFRWRFLERASGAGVIAYDEGRPVGFVDSFVRPYRTTSGVVVAREPADWYCHPDYQPVVSMKLIKAFMDRPEPMLIVGGNRNSTTLLPRIGCKELPDLATYILPTGVGSVVKGLSKRLGFSLSSVPRSAAVPLSLGFRRPREAPRPEATLDVRQVVDGETAPLVPAETPGYGLAPAFPVEEYEWFRRAPERIGAFRLLVFESEGQPVGLSLSRLHGEGPFTAARLLHVEASRPSVPLYAWMIAETVQLLLRARTQWITARFSCPMTCAALARQGFRAMGRCRAFWWHRQLPAPDGPLHLTWITGDEAFVPYPP